MQRTIRVLLISGTALIPLNATAAEPVIQQVSAQGCTPNSCTPEGCILTTADQVAVTREDPGGADVRLAAETIAKPATATVDHVTSDHRRGISH